MKFERILAVCISASLLHAAPAVWAEDGVIEEIVVTGIRSSLKAANDIKRGETRIVDAIVAEDIGKLPDNNIAEALQRITGVSINTDFGIGDSVSIRGLSQNRVELNGRTTLGDSRDGISLQDFPSSFLKSVEVIKSPTADMIEGALGGTVRLNTVRPLDLKQATVAGAIDGEYADKTENWAPIFNISLGNNWTLGNGAQFGAIAMVAYQDREIRQDEFFSRVILTEGPENLTANTPSGLFALRDQPTFQQFEEDRERTALSLSLQYAPESGRGNFYLDLSTTDRDGEQRGNSILDVAGVPVYDDRTTVDTHGQLNNFGLEGAFVIPKTWSNFRRTESFSHALGGEWDFRENLTVSAEVSIAESESDNPVSEFNLRPIDRNLWTDFRESYVPGVSEFNEGALRATVDSFFSQNGDNLPSITYDNDQAYLDPNTLALRAFWSDDIQTENEETAFRADVDYRDVFTSDSFSVTSLKVGVRFTENDYTFSLSRYRANNIYRDAFTDIGTDEERPFAVWVDDLEAAFPGTTGVTTHNDTFDQLGDSGEFVHGSYLTVLGDVVSDPDQSFAIVQELFGETNFAVDGSLADNQVLDEGAFRDVREDTAAIYISADFELGRLRGNVGIRYVDTDIESDVVSGGVRRTDKESYDDFLPSINLSYDVNENTIARFAAAEVMRRADYAQLSSAFLVDSFFTVGSRGKADLDPFRSTQYDLSVEHYMENGGIISAAIFYKDVESFLTTNDTCVADPRTVEQNTTEFGNICLFTNGGSETNVQRLTQADFAFANLTPDQLSRAGAEASFDAGDFGTSEIGLLASQGLTGILTSTQANGQNGDVQGIELGIQLPFDFLPGFWNGFGFNGNYTYADSEQPNGNSLLDISEHTLNTQFYFENDRFQARVAYNYRSDFLDTENERRVDRIGAFTSSVLDDPTIGNNYRDDRGQVDVSASWNINDHFTLVATATNLTGEPSIFQTELGSNWQYTEADQRFAIGIRGKW